VHVSRILRIVVASIFATLATFATTMTSAQAAPDDSQVVINDASGPTTHRFSVNVPPGGSLQAARPVAGSNPSKSDILVRDSQGVVVGAYDAAWALDAASMPVASTFRIQGTELIQTVSLTGATTFPVTFGLSYSPISGGSPNAPGGSQTTAAGFVSVPSNYVYNPALGSHHDYCTAAPDEFHAPFASNASFRGPCARHDLCYAGSTQELTCDNRLRSDMRANCAYQYGQLNPLRSACYRTADIYWAAVVIA